MYACWGIVYFFVWKCGQHFGENTFLYRWVTDILHLYSVKLGTVHLCYALTMGDKSRSLSRTSSQSSQRNIKHFYQFRFIIIGDSTVGKSSLIRQFTEGSFVDTFPADPTVGVDFHVRVIEVSGKCKFSIRLVFTMKLISAALSGQTLA